VYLGIIIKMSGKSGINQVFATGNWRKSPGKIDKLNVLLGNKWNVQLLSQKDEAIGQAKSAYTLMKKGHVLDNIKDDSLVLFMGAGRGSTQVVLMDMSGNVYDIKMGPGYSKNGPPPVEELRKLFMELSDVSGLDLVVAFDSFYHICKSSCPVVPDEDYLPTSVTTTCNDFSDALEILPDNWSNIPMIVVRNFKVVGLDDLCKIGHLTTFEKGNGIYDLGSGRVAVTDPLNGTFRYEALLPDNWDTSNDDEVLLAIADLIRAGESTVDFEKYSKV
jgi:hypothetical protein